MNDNIVKIELGCGKTKQDGYIGIDRFSFDCVDIVADINNGIPIEDNSVDIIFASHSLEHFDDLQFIMSEIFRICKHGAIIYVLAPYYNTTTNWANFYHKIAFNEDVFRFFTNSSDTFIDELDYYSPQCTNWGLSQSDNSANDVDFFALNMEYFYFPGYGSFTNEEKRMARKSFNNVCEQIFYTLAVNKNKVIFSNEEKSLLVKNAINNEPPIIDFIRNRLLDDKYSNNILQHFCDKQKNVIEVLENQLIEQINSSNITIGELTNKINELTNKVNNLNNQFTSDIYKLNDQLDKNNKNVSHISSFLLEHLKINENKKNKIIKKLYRPKNSVDSFIKAYNQEFYNHIILDNDNFTNNSYLALSSFIPFDSYFEYKITNLGIIQLFILGNFHSSVMLEFVKNNTIICQDFITLNESFIYTKKLDIQGEMIIRIRTLNDHSLVRVVEISSKQSIVFAKKSLAYNSFP